MGSDVGQDPQILSLWEYHWYPCPPQSGESPAAGEPPKTGTGRDARGLPSLPWAGLNPSAGPRSLEQMAEMPEDTTPLELKVMGRGYRDAASALGAPTGPPLLYSEAARGKSVAFPDGFHMSPQVSTPQGRADCRGVQSPCFPQKQSPPTPRVKGLAQTSSSLGETPKPSQHRLDWEG